MSNVIEWNKANVQWNDNPFLWSDIQEIIAEIESEIESGVSSWEDVDKDKKKRKRIIRLIMERKGIKVYDERKEIKNIKVHLDDIKLVAEEIKKNVQIIHG